MRISYTDLNGTFWSFILAPAKAWSLKRQLAKLGIKAKIGENPEMPKIEADQLAA